MYPISWEIFEFVSLPFRDMSRHGIAWYAAPSTYFQVRSGMKRRAARVGGVNPVLQTGVPNLAFTRIST